MPTTAFWDCFTRDSLGSALTSCQASHCTCPDPFQEVRLSIRQPSCLRPQIRIPENLFDRVIWGGTLFAVLELWNGILQSTETFPSMNPSGCSFGQKCSMF